MTPAFTPAPTAHAALVLGETFALWISLFLLLQVAAGAVVAAIGDAVTTPVQLGFSLCAMFGSLVALAYPRLRGVSWSALRELLGLHVGRGVVRETIAGLHCYVTAVPLLVAGLIVFAILSAIAQAVSGAAEEPSHPVVDLLGNAGALEIVMLFALASVAAPIVEEIAFRGLLYGHLRGVVEPRIRLLSVLVAALMSSVVFAIIHPQGVLFVPALGGLAVGFCLFRELRGSLIAPMVAHCVSNAVTLSIGLTMMS
jgi:membrane protease YdiL (CAAX protease family)